MAANSRKFLPAQTSTFDSAMPNPIPRALRMLGTYGGSALQASLDRGKYIAPKVSRRVAANLRKRALVEGTYGSFSVEAGGWDPEWDIPRKMFMMRPFKGHARDRNREIRAKKITDAMTSMPERLASLDKEVESRKPKKDIAFMFKKLGGRAAKVSR